MNIKKKITTSQSNLPVTSIKKYSVFISMIICVIIAFLQYYNKDYDLLTTILNGILFLCAGCYFASRCFPKYNISHLINEIASLTLVWSLFTLCLIECLQQNYFGVISPYILLPVSIFTLYLLVKNTLVNIIDKEKLYKCQCHQISK